MITLPKEIAELFLLLHRAGIYQEGEYTGDAVTLGAQLRAPSSGLYGDERVFLPDRSRLSDLLTRAEVYGYAKREPAVNQAQLRDPVWRIFDAFHPRAEINGHGPARVLPVVMSNCITAYFDSAAELHEFEGWFRSYLNERPRIAQKIKLLAAHVAP